MARETLPAVEGMARCPACGQPHSPLDIHQFGYVTDMLVGASLVIPAADEGSEGDHV